jgi:hypothetical protein
LITRAVLKLDFKKILIFDGIKLSQVEQEFGEILQDIAVLQEQKDYAGIADKVEYELLTNLHAWSVALRHLHYGQRPS